MGSFLKNINDIMKYGSKPTTFYDAEMLTIYWETKPELIKRILPPPLKPAKRPLVHAFIANYPKTNFCPPYKEAGLFILADYNGELGTYCLSMPITDGIGMALGREFCGLPKKMADIDFKKDKTFVEGTVGRHGIDFFNVKVNLNGKLNDENAEKILAENYGKGLPMFNIKYSKAIDGSGFDLKPTLVKQSINMDTTVLQAGEVEITLKDSPHDPWAELEVVKMLGGIYTVSTNVLLKGTILEEINPMSFIPYSYLRWDWWEDTLD
ncbi:acetoacetate decarboxylase family protein [Clostridium lundense]|uniref:acetoacetate decarboxylase family protein n=1 Tax=Clostridium lundense TaxID=319475 RepID=UPI000688E44D|nr:acetoacetate decarboxylase family protein [Clostridium lundense]